VILWVLFTLDTGRCKKQYLDLGGPVLSIWNIIALKYGFEHAVDVNKVKNESQNDCAANKDAKVHVARNNAQRAQKDAFSRRHAIRERAKAGSSACFVC
jgi:hypothetical protein